MCFFKENVNQNVRDACFALVKVLGFRAPGWTHALFSLFLSLASINNADLLTLTPEAAFCRS